MIKIDKTVKQESLYILYTTLILSILMQAIFLIISKWSVSVLLGNAVGASAAVLNFFLMGLSVQKAMTKKDEKEIKQFIRLTMTLRLFMMIIIALIIYILPFLHTVAAILPYLFPRIAIALRPVIKKD